eukprot:TRINITY_DN1333_c0_g1_i1.p1 TRINITY_DN1333_c0_g1~~TRINITY_DN1333_c0_g1_i1.p1  ORF type:complete len:645 (+),score=91.50 TRINITY_DN1333_c0_g1_i1:247-2181(+)
MNQETKQVQVLWGIAEQFVYSGEIRNAILCLEAIVQSPISLFITDEAKTRIRLTEILLKYTQNHTEAKLHIDMASTLLDQVPSEKDLKLQVYYFYSIIYERLNNKSGLKQVLGLGLELSKDFDFHWYQFFLLKMAKVCGIDESDMVQATEYLQLGIETTKKVDSLPFQILFNLSCLQLNLHANDLESCVHYMNEAQELLFHFRSECRKSVRRGSFSKNTRKDHINSPFKSPSSKLLNEKTQTLMMLEIQYHILIIIYNIQKADYKDIFNTLENLQKLVNSLANAESDLVKFTWLPKTHIYLCTYLLSIYCNKPIGNYETISGFIEKGVKLTSDLYKQEGNKRYIIFGGDQFVSSLIRYRFKFHENQIYINLCRSNLSTAIKGIAQCHKLCRKYPKYLDPIQAGTTLNILLGLYSYLTGNTEYAKQHLSSAFLKSDENSEVALIAMIHKSLIHLSCNEPGPVFEFVNAFSERLRAHRSSLIRASLLFIEARLSHIQKKNDEAKEKIKECLAIANGTVVHNQLASVALNFLGMMTMLDGVYNERAETILKSALVISYKSEDLYNQLQSQKLLSELRINTGDTQAAYNELYLSKITTVLSKNITEAKRKKWNQLVQDYILDPENSLSPSKKRKLETIDDRSSKVRKL